MRRVVVTGVGIAQRLFGLGDIITPLMNERIEAFDLGLELASAPAGITERHERGLRAVATAERGENVERYGDLDVARGRERAIERLRRLVQDEPALGLDGAARARRRIGLREREVQKRRQRQNRPACTSPLSCSASRLACAP